MAYVKLTGELEDLGCRPLVLIHDYPYRFDVIGNSVTVPEATLDFRHDVERLTRTVGRQLQSRRSVVTGTKYLGGRHGSRSFAVEFYRRFLPALVNVERLAEGAQPGKSTAVILLDQLRYLLKLG